MRLISLLSSPYDIGYNSTVSVYFEVIKNIEDEIIECASEYKHGRLNDHQFSHLICGLCCIDYIPEYKELIINILNIGLSSDNAEVRDVSIMLIESIGVDDVCFIDMLKNVNMGCEWQEDYRLQVISDLEEG